LIHNPKVGGSIPPPATNSFNKSAIRNNGQLRFSFTCDRMVTVLIFQYERFTRTVDSSMSLSSRFLITNVSSPLRKQRGGRRFAKVAAMAESSQPDGAKSTSFSLTGSILPQLGNILTWGFEESTRLCVY